MAAGLKPHGVHVRVAREGALYNLCPGLGPGNAERMMDAAAQAAALTRAQMLVAAAFAAAYLPRLIDPAPQVAETSHC